jgi:hypothetical protein
MQIRSLMLEIREHYQINGIRMAMCRTPSCHQYINATGRMALARETTVWYDWLNAGERRYTYDKWKVIKQE